MALALAAGPSGTLFTSDVTDVTSAESELISNYPDTPLLLAKQ